MSGRLSGLDDLYEDVVMDHYRNPRHNAPLDNPPLADKLFNPLCGDESNVQLAVSEGRIARLAVFGRGCAISQAAGSMLAESVAGLELADAARLVRHARDLLTGKPLGDEELDRLGDTGVLEGVRKFPVRIKCALLPWTVLHDLLGQAR